jgi:arabinose-5-phosphate isomerase
MTREHEELDFARSILRTEADAIHALAARIGPEFTRAVDLIDTCANAGGNVLVTGLGKSGLIGSKIAATLSSLGITSHSVHPSEAAHGDLGRFRSSDTVIAMSFSGETEEVVNLAAILRQDALPIISMTGGGTFDAPRPQSSLERLATVSLRVGVAVEASGVAPTTSTTAMAALGDALALASARRRNFSDHDFAKRHPGGSLGGQLRSVMEVLRFIAGQNLPVALHTRTLREALHAAATVARRPGAMLLVDPVDGKLTGIFTDGDLRRLILNNPAALDLPAEHSMTRKPRTLPDSALVRDAIHMIQEYRQDEIPVVDSDGKPVGILDVQDLIAMRLVRRE